MKPRLLDLFCGAGGAAKGYQRAGFYVVGVDARPQPNYCGDEFVQDDAIALVSAAPEWVQTFDAIHASPPCQRFSRSTRDKSKHPDLIAPLRPLLIASGLPYVIENVPGAPLIDPVTICGSSLALRVRRHRLFETDWALLVPPCDHKSQGQPIGVYGGGTGKSQKRGRKTMSADEAREVMEMPWAVQREIVQAIPPAYTELIGLQLMQHVQRLAA